MKCFLIDDDQDDQDFFALALDELAIDISFSASNNGIEALKILKAGSYRPDIIFIDLNMPRMDGWECLSEIKKIPALNNIPVIIYSTSDPNGERMKGDFTAYLTKRPGNDALTSALSDILSKIEIRSKSI